jgi:hypothetical protein
MARKPAPRYRVRVVGDRFDWVRKYAVIDSRTGRRERGGPFYQWQAWEIADDLNGVPLDERKDWTTDLAKMAQG